MIYDLEITSKKQNSLEYYFFDDRSQEAVIGEIDTHDIFEWILLMDHNVLISDTSDESGNHVQTITNVKPQLFYQELFTEENLRDYLTFKKII